MDHVSPVILPALGRVGTPQGADVPALVDLRTFGPVDFTDETAGQRQRSQHFRANTGEVLFVFGTIKLVRAIRIVFAELSNEAVFLSRLILRRVPVVHAPKDTHPAEITLE